MNTFFNQFFFGIFPYIAVSVFIVGSFLRYEHLPYGWRSGSSQLMEKKINWASNLFHVGIIVILLGHLVGLLLPKSIYHLFMSSGQKQFLAILVGGIAGIFCFIGLTLLIVRRFTNPRVRATSSFSDNLILILLYIQLILGLISILFSLQHKDGSAMVALATWAQHVVTFQGDAATYVLNESLIFKLHITLGLSILLITPFTRLVHVWSVPLGYIFTRKGYQIVRKRN